MTLDELRALAGGVPPQLPITAPVIVQQDPGCKLKTRPGVTSESVKIDTSKLIPSACGRFTIWTRTTDTGITANLLWILGMEADNTNTATTEPLRNLGNFAATIGSVYDNELALDSADGATYYGGFELSAWLNQVFNGKPVLIGRVEMINTGGVGAAIVDAQIAQAWVANGINIKGEYALSSLDYPSNNCSECVNSGDPRVGIWTFGGLPLSVTESLSITLIDGGDFKWIFCVDAMADVTDFVNC